MLHFHFCQVLIYLSTNQYFSIQNKKIECNITWLETKYNILTCDVTRVNVNGWFPCLPNRLTFFMSACASCNYFQFSFLIVVDFLGLPCGLAEFLCHASAYVFLELKISIRKTKDYKSLHTQVEQLFFALQFFPI